MRSTAISAGARIVAVLKESSTSKTPGICRESQQTTNCCARPPLNSGLGWPRAETIERARAQQVVFPGPEPTIEAKSHGKVPNRDDSWGWDWQGSRAGRARD